MTDKHDYKGALGLAEYHPSTWSDEDWEKSKHTFKAALKIADRLQSGEVSEGMIWAATQLQKGRSECASPRSVFRVMTAQLLKEIEDENAG